ncbi:MAG TPA: universal stress protein [Dehalococcoidia bacterium]|nr:universal stress protein [Dehalococcoidia bacterium]
MQAGRTLNVLWATDGSAASRSAVPLLRELVLPVATRLTVLTVGPHPLFSHARPDPGFLRKATPAARRLALAEARETAEREAMALDPSVPVEPIAAWGHPVQEILTAARRTKADLIVLAAKGHSDLRIALLGSVSDGVARLATTPLLVARPGAAGPSRVVVGYHDSVASRRALSFLTRLSLPASAEVVLVTAVEPLAVPDGTPAAARRRLLAEASGADARRREEAAKALEALRAELEAGGRRVETEVAAGPAAEQIDQAARRHRAGLIVVGSRRPAPGAQFSRGQTAERLVRHAHSSVLVVR